MKMDPVDFILKNMVQPGPQRGLHQLHAGPVRPPRSRALRVEEALEAGSPGPVPGRSSAAPASPSCRSVRPSARAARVITVDAKQQYTLYVGVTDVGPGAKTTMNMIAADELGVPLSKVKVVWGDTDTCPYSVGESGSRTTTMTGEAVIAAVRDLQEADRRQGHAERQRPPARRAPRRGRVSTGRRATASARTSSRWRSTLNSAAVKFLKFVAVHESGRIMNPLTAASQVKGGVAMGVGMALHENMIYDQRTGRPVVTGYYFDRVVTHLDAPDVRGRVHRSRRRLRSVRREGHRGGWDDHDARRRSPTPSSMRSGGASRICPSPATRFWERSHEDVCQFERALSAGRVKPLRAGAESRARPPSSRAAAAMCCSL